MNNLCNCEERNGNKLADNSRPFAFTGSGERRNGGQGRLAEKQVDEGLEVDVEEYRSDVASMLPGRVLNIQRHLLDRLQHHRQRTTGTRTAWRMSHVTSNPSTARPSVRSSDRPTGRQFARSSVRLAEGRGPPVDRQIRTPIFQLNERPRFLHVVAD